MNHPDRRESIIHRIVLAPVRLLERSRGRRRLFVVALYGLIVLVTWAILWRRAQLRHLPDIGDPFAVFSPVVPAQVPDDRNAFIPYRQAAGLYREMSPAERTSFTQANLDWSKADATIRKWVDDHREAIALLREGSTRPEVSPGPSWDPADHKSTDLVTRLSWICTASLFEAGRLREAKDPDEAWKTLIAAVRATRNMERLIATQWSRLTATLQVQFAQGPIDAWAKDPAVSVAQLRQALDDLVAAEALTPPPSAFYRESYRAAEASLGRSLWRVVAERNRERIAFGTVDPVAYVPSLEVFFRNEPERSRRVLRLLAANDLAWINRPVADWPAYAVPRLRIYDPDPAAPTAARALPPDELAKWADSALILDELWWRLGAIESGERQSRWSMGLLKEAVAVSLFKKEMGRPPKSPAEALQRYLPMPGDSPDRDESEPIPEVSKSERAPLSPE